MSISSPSEKSAIQLTEEDIAFLLAVLRDPSLAQPLTTQQLIDALRARASR